MQSDILTKNQKTLGDSTQTFQEGLSKSNQLQMSSSNNSSNIHTRNVLNSLKLQRCQQGTITDQSICNCSCQSIPKLKQKAHKSFMQVIQVQNLYKQQIKQLKNFYQQSLSSKDNTHKQTQESLLQKCKQLEQQIQKIRASNPYPAPTENFAIENPFESDSIDGIVPNPNAVSVDQNNQSIFNIRQFIQTTNMKEKAQRMETQIGDLVAGFRKTKEGVACTGNRIDGGQELFGERIQKLENLVKKIFQFISNMIENTVQAHQKYNQLVLVLNQIENRYNKLNGLHQAGIKQAKFMTEHIKKLSQDKIKMEKKSNQLERVIKNQEQNLKFLKKFVAQKQVPTNSEAQKKDFDSLSAYNQKQSSELDLSKGLSLLSSKIERRTNAMARSAQNSQGDKILPRSLNFKKKVGQPQRLSQKQ